MQLLYSCSAWLLIDCVIDEKLDMAILDTIGYIPCIASYI